MSFGWSANDIVGLVQLGWKVVRNTQKACGEHDELTHEVSALHIVLQKLQYEAKKEGSPIVRDGTSAEELASIAGGCRKVLDQLDKILDKYNALSSQERSVRKLWQRVRFGNGQVADLGDLRAKVTYYASALSLFMNMATIGSIGRVEKKMDEAGGDLKDIRRAVNGITAHLMAKSRGEGSVWTTYEDDDRAFWRELRKNLIKNGFPSSVIREHKTTIIDYIQELGSRGLLDDETPRSPAINPKEFGRSMKGTQYKFEERFTVDGLGEEDPKRKTRLPPLSSSRPSMKVETTPLATTRFFAVRPQLGFSFKGRSGFVQSPWGWCYIWNGRNVSLCLEGFKLRTRLLFHRISYYYAENILEKNDICADLLVLQDFVRSADNIFPFLRGEYQPTIQELPQVNLETSSKWSNKIWLSCRDLLNARGSWEWPRERLYFMLDAVDSWSFDFDLAFTASFFSNWRMYGTNVIHSIAPAMGHFTSTNDGDPEDSANGPLQMTEFFIHERRAREVWRDIEEIWKILNFECTPMVNKFVTASWDTTSWPGIRERSSALNVIIYDIMDLVFILDRVNINVKSASFIREKRNQNYRDVSNLRSAMIDKSLDLLLSIEDIKATTWLDFAKIRFEKKTYDTSSRVCWYCGNRVFHNGRFTTPEEYENFELEKQVDELWHQYHEYAAPSAIKCMTRSWQNVSARKVAYHKEINNINARVIDPITRLSKLDIIAIDRDIKLFAAYDMIDCLRSCLENSTDQKGWTFADGRSESFTHECPETSDLHGMDTFVRSVELDINPKNRIYTAYHGLDCTGNLPYKWVKL